MVEWDWGAIATLGGASVAYFALASQRALMRKGNTLQQIASMETDRDYLQARARYAKLERHELKIMDLVARKVSLEQREAAEAERQRDQAEDKGHADRAKALADERAELVADAMAVTTTLNAFEMIAVGIRHGVYDYATWRIWAKTSTIATWQNSKPYIMHFRTTDVRYSRLFVELEALADWLDEDSHENKRKKPPMYVRWVNWLPL